MQKFYIGVKNNKVTGSKETISQINEIKKYQLSLTDRSGTKLTWDMLDNSKESLFHSIIADRKVRVDRNEIMADRPPYCAISLADDEIVRLEYYEGHDGLEQIYDLRRHDLYDRKLPPNMKNEHIEDTLFNELDIVTKLIKDKRVKKMQKALKMSHSAIIQRESKSQLKYYGRQTETLLEHQEKLRQKFENEVEKILFC